MVREEMIVTRPDGRQYKIVTLAGIDVFSGTWYDSFVLSRKNSEEAWENCKPRYVSRIDNTEVEPCVTFAEAFGVSHRAHLQLTTGVM